MKRKGQIWVSAALYIALGIIVISVVLSAGLPLINKIQAKNTLLQSKNVMFELDSTIRDVMLEGAGSKRPIYIEIEKGNNPSQPMKGSVEIEVLPNLNVESSTGGSSGVGGVKLQWKHDY